MFPLGLKWLHKNTAEKTENWRKEDTNVIPVRNFNVKCVTAEPYGRPLTDGAAHMKVFVLEPTVLTMMDRASTLMMLRDLDRL